MAGDTVLVTGAAGFIGSHLTARLAARGATVRALDVAPRPESLDATNIDYRRGDIRDPALMAELLTGADTVYHLASVHLAVHESEAAFEAVNVGATEALVEACAEARVGRLVHTSSVGIYGHVEDPPAGEDSPKHPQTPYERTKLRGETAALRKADEVGLDVIVLRPAWVYGPGCPRTAKLMRTLRKGRFFYMGSGGNLRHPIYIDDMVDAFLLAASAPAERAARAYIIAGPRYMPLREMIDTFSAALQVPPPRLSIPVALGRGLGLAAEIAFGLLRREPPFSRRSLAFFENDNGFTTVAAERDLGFHPRVDLEEGLRRTLAASEEVPPQRAVAAATTSDGASAGTGR